MAGRSGATRTADLVPRAGLTSSVVHARERWLTGSIAAAVLSKPSGPR
jgi:hypothetical protein